MSTLNFNCEGDPKDDHPTLVADNPPGGTTLASHFEGVAGRLPNRFVATVPPEITGGAWLTYQQGRKRFRIIVPPGPGSWEATDPKCFPPEYGSDLEKVALIYTPDVATLPALQIVGRYFRQNGQRFFLNGATGFNATGRFIYEGADAIRPVLAQRQALGFNAVRLWSAYNIPLIGRVIPREHADFYTQLVPGVSALCAEYGQYPYWTGLTGPYSVTLGGMNEIIAHDLQMQQALAQIPYALYDRRNEFSKDVNQVDGARLPPFSLNLASQGSGQQDEDPPSPYGRFYARHPASSEWQRKVGKQNIDFANSIGLNSPGADDETVRCEPGGETNRQHAHDAAACGALFIAGAFYHSAKAKLFVPWDVPFTGKAGSELDLAEGWCDGVRFIEVQGLEIAQDGQYVHRTDWESDTIIRGYEKRLGSRSVVLKVAA